MEAPRPIWTMVILVVTVLVSLKGFRSPVFRERFLFEPVPILRDRQFYRMFTSGFLHGDSLHLFVNGYSFYAFAQGIELVFGAGNLLLIYLGSILGGSVLSLWLHRHHDYRALGASGGVCGVIFASIFLFPGGSVVMFPIPFGIPSWLYAVAFLILSFVGVRRGTDNIGHDAHLGGAITGLLITTALHPAIIHASPRLYATVMGISTALLLVLWRCPAWLPGTDLPDWWRRLRANSRNRNVGRDQVEDDAEMDRLLDKIRGGGLHSLSEKERRRLGEIASRKRRP